MNRADLISSIKAKASFLCVGLDPDLKKIPTYLHSNEDPIFEFNKAIIDATREYCVAYKPNIAFFECLGENGWRTLRKTVEYIGDNHLIIADAKRGDIGNTSAMYARTFFEAFGFDAVTVAPYMGSDSVKPFMDYSGKWVIILALTSNEGADDFQLKPMANGNLMYEQVLKSCASWGSIENTMFVTGATRPEQLQEVRKIVPHHFLLVPGVGAQGGSLAEVCKFGLNSDIGLLINASRSIIYASPGVDFAKAAAHEAKKLSMEMKNVLKENRLL
jgi:orotidine-5'-phosphate decarboxylase